MKLKKPFVTKILIFFLFCLSFFSLSLFFCKSIVSKKTIYYVSDNIKVIKYLKENEELNKIFNDKKIPLDVLNYIDENELKTIMNTAVDNLYNKDNNIINPKDVELLIKNSINIYERKYTLDIYSYVAKEVESFSINLEQSVNEFEIIALFNGTFDILNGFVPILFYIITFILALSLVIIEGKNGLLIVGITSLIFSIISFYFSTNIILEIANNINLFKYINESVVAQLGKILEPLYMILFFVGFLLIIIYAVFYIKRIIAKSRIEYYDKYYGR